MRDPSSLARIYLAPPALSFWKWSENGRVVVWQDGTTIAFRQEIVFVLDRLAPAGLPPFGALVLLLAACRPGWTGTGRIAVDSHLRDLERLGTLDGRFPPPWMEEVLDGLDAVHRTRIEFRTGAEAKAVLAEVVFDGVEGRGSPDEAASILSAIRSGDAREAPAEETISKWLVFRFLQDLSVIRQGLKRVDDETLEMRGRTGLDRAPVPAPVPDDAVSESIRRLLLDLREDRELAGLAKLAEHLMAAVHVPRRMSDPEELPLGGVSDITNRGPIDRLLVSELAYDDLTLATRIALGEALYLRREQPPRNLPGRRAILLDAGIRMWGVPRLFGAAVALALAATADRFTQISAWRATEEGIVPVDLATREGVMGLLEALEPSPVPSEGIAAFLRKTAGGKGPVDAILVTHEDVLQDPEFSSALAGLEDRSIDVATVGAGGLYRMFSVTRRGRRLAGEAHLSLATILAPPKPDTRGVPLLPPNPDAAFPLLLSVDPFPFLLPHEVDPRRAASHPQSGVVAATRDGRLMHWTGRDRGARELTAVLPRGVLHWISIEDEGFALALVGSSRSALHLVSADLAAGRCTVLRLPATGYPPVGAFRHEDAFCLVYARKMDVFDLRTGEIREVHQLPHGTSWITGRYFFDGEGWSCAAFDGITACFTRVPKAGSNAGFLAVFDRRGRDGPWAIDRRGHAVSLADGSGIAFHHALSSAGSIVGVSRDGDRVVLRGTAASARRHVLLNLESGTAAEIYGDPLHHLEPAFLRLPRRSVRHKFGAIGRDERSLVLFPPSGRPVEIALLPDGKAMVLRHRTGLAPVAQTSFAFTPAPRGARFALRVAAFSDGSRAWTDSRGMLHLRSSDPLVPEVSIVLADEGELAGWSSDGHLCGPPYLLGDRRPDDPASVFSSLLRFASTLP